MSRTPPRRGIRSGVRARARRNAFLLRAAAERQVDPLSVAVVHSGGAARPLYTSRFWEPSSSEGEELEEEEEETGGEVTRHDNVIDLTSLQAEELVLRSRLWRPTSKAVAKAVQGGPSSSSTLPSSSSASTLDPLRFFRPPPGCVSDPSRRPTAAGRAVQLPATAKYFWHQQTRVVPLRDHLYKWGGCPVIAFDYHQVIDTDRYGSRGDADRVTSAGALPPRHVETIRRLRNLSAFVKIVIVSHIHDSVANKQNLVTAVQSVFTSHLHVIHLGLWAFGCCGATPTVPFLDSYLLRLTSVEVSFDFQSFVIVFHLPAPIAQSRVSSLSAILHCSVTSFKFHCIEFRAFSSREVIPTVVSFTASVFQVQDCVSVSQLSQFHT